MRCLTYGVAAIVALVGATSETRSDPVPAPEYQLEVSVFMCDPSITGLVPQAAVVVLRDRRGTPIFKGNTDAHGTILVPIDYRSLGVDYQLEARLDLGAGGYIGGLLTPHLHSKHYNLLIPTPVNIDKVVAGTR
jgi:hypothetical protein